MRGNTAIQGAVEKLISEPTSEHFRDVVRWMVGDDTGNSSMAIASAAVGILENCSHPYDPDDLGRCLRLLRDHPWMREPAFIALKGATHTPWRQLIHHWDELASLMESEVGLDWEKGTTAPKTYRAMKNIGC